MVPNFSFVGPYGPTLLLTHSFPTHYISTVQSALPYWRTDRSQHPQVSPLSLSLSVSHFLLFPLPIERAHPTAEESESRQAIKWFVPLSLGAWTARRRAPGQDKDVVPLGCTGTMPEINHVKRALSSRGCPWTFTYKAWQRCLAWGYTFADASIEGSLESEWVLLLVRQR